MNTVLLILGLLSVGAVVIASYVFMAAARNYVSDGLYEQETMDDPQADGVDNPSYILRSAQDRRQINNVIDFPITLPNGKVVAHDRRLCERRSVG